MRHFLVKEGGKVLCCAVICMLTHCSSRIASGLCIFEKQGVQGEGTITSFAEGGSFFEIISLTVAFFLSGIA